MAHGWWGGHFMGRTQMHTHTRTCSASGSDRSAISPSFSSPSPSPLVELVVASGADGTTLPDPAFPFLPSPAQLLRLRSCGRAGSCVREVEPRLAECSSVGGSGGAGEVVVAAESPPAAILAGLEARLPPKNEFRLRRIAAGRCSSGVPAAPSPSAVTGDVEAEKDALLVRPAGSLPRITGAVLTAAAAAAADGPPVVALGAPVLASAGCWAVARFRATKGGEL